MLFFWMCSSNLIAGLKIIESKTQILNRYFRVKTVRDKRMMHLWYKWTVQWFFQQKHWKHKSQLSLRQTKFQWKKRAGTEAWNWPETFVWNLTCLNNLQISGKKGKDLWDIPNNSYSGFIFKCAETKFSREYLFLLGTEWKYTFFRLDTQTKERQNSRQLYHLAELVISVQKYLKFKIIEELSSI